MIYNLHLNLDDFRFILYIELHLNRFWVDSLLKPALILNIVLELLPINQEATNR